MAESSGWPILQKRVPGTRPAISSEEDCFWWVESAVSSNLGVPYTARHSLLNGQRQRNNRKHTLTYGCTISTTLEFHRGILQRGWNATETPRPYLQ